MSRISVKEDRKIQIMEAMGKCLLQKSFRETTIKDIARTAGVTHGVLHYYFKSKHDILLSFIDDKLNKYFADVADWFNSQNLDKLPREKLMGIILKYNLDLLLNNKEDFKLLLAITCIANYDNKVKNRLKKAFDQIARVEFDLISRAGVDKKSAAELNDTIIFLFSGLSLFSILFDYEDRRAAKTLKYFSSVIDG